MLTSRPPPAWTIFSGSLPPRAARTRSRASTICSSSISLIPTGTVTRSRSLPLTWTGTSRVSSTTAVSSTTGHDWVWIDAHGSPAAASRRDHSSSVMWGADGASISSSRLTASSHSGRPATDVPR